MPVPSTMANKDLVSNEMDELRKPAISTLSLTALAVSGAWLVAIAALHYTLPPLAVIGPPLLLFCTSLSCLALRALSARYRAALLLLGLAGTLCLGFAANPSRD